MKALSIQEYIDLRDESREHFGVTLHLHDHCTSQYLSSDGQPFDDRYSAYLLDYFDKDYDYETCNGTRQHEPFAV